MIRWEAAGRGGSKVCRREILKESTMPDDMFFSRDERSLRRGKRVAKRTDTCRACLVVPKDGAGQDIEGVVMDVSPYGMLIRMMETLPIGTEVTVQLMRDESFREPFSTPHSGTVVRYEGSPGRFTDHGVELEVKEIIRQESRPVNIAPRRPSPPTPPTRMHTIDFTVGGDSSKGRPTR